MTTRPDSARRHREAARAAGVAPIDLALASLAIDLDQPEDLATFLATEGGGARTRALLEQPRGSAIPNERASRAESPPSPRTERDAP